MGGLYEVFATCGHQVLAVNAALCAYEFGSFYLQLYNEDAEKQGPSRLELQQSAAASAAAGGDRKLKLPRGEEVSLVTGGVASLNGMKNYREGYGPVKNSSDKKFGRYDAEADRDRQKNKFAARKNKKERVAAELQAALKDKDRVALASMRAGSVGVSSGVSIACNQVLYKIFLTAGLSGGSAAAAGAGAVALPTSAAGFAAIGTGTAATATSTTGTLAAGALVVSSGLVAAVASAAAGIYTASV